MASHALRNETGSFLERAGAEACEVKLPKSPIERALAAAQALLDIQGVVGVGQGERESGACVVVFVAGRTPRLAATIPREILGVPVEVRATRTPSTH